MDAKNNFEYGKTYYIDKTGILIDESDAKQLHTKCTPVVETCCCLKMPQGFEFKSAFPNMSFDLSKLSCIKNPRVEKVALNTQSNEKTLECDVVAGYEVRAIGVIDFSFSAPIYPKQGFYFPSPSHTCCTSTVPVNKIISYTCCPKACPSDEICYDWHFAYFCAREVSCRYGSFLQITLGLALEYTGPSENDDE